MAEWTDEQCLDLYQRVHKAIVGNEDKFSDDTTPAEVIVEVRTVLGAASEKDAAAFLRVVGYGAPEQFAEALRRLAQVPDRVTVEPMNSRANGYIVRVDGAAWARVPGLRRDKEAGQRRADLIARGLRLVLEESHG